MSNPMTMSEQDMNKSAQAEEIPLLTPCNMGIFNLSHRIVLAPMTRLRCEEFSPQPHVGLYYSQRTTQGGLLVSEATAISETAQGSPNTPGIWKKEHVEAWKPIVNAVHHKGGIFFCQIRHEGKFSANEKKELGRRVSGDEMKIFVEDFKAAARNAREAGFDGVEIHAGHGYLVDQFLKAKLINDDDADNNGTTLDLENRCRFPLQVVKAVADEIGPERVGVRLSPFAGEEALANHVAGALSQIGVVYCHVMRPFQLEAEDTSSSLSLLAMRHAFQGTFIVSGGYDRSEGNQVVENGAADLVAYGRMFLANPDLPIRFRLNAQLNNPHPSTFAILHPVIGYTDYPFLSLPST